MHYGVPVTEFDGSEGVDALWSAAAELQQTGVQVALGGEVPENFAPPSGTAELIGIGVALVILVFAFGSVIAAGLPLAVALVGLGVGSSLITVLAAVHRRQQHRADDRHDGRHRRRHRLRAAAGHPVRRRTARRAAGARGRGPGQRHRRRVGGVRRHHRAGLACSGLRLAGLPVYTSVGVATLLVVGAVMLTSITLVPALCGLAGTRVLRRCERRALPVAADGALHGPAPAPPRPDASGRPIHRDGPLGGADRAAAVAVGARRAGLAAAARRAGARHADLAAGRRQRAGVDTTRVAYDLVAAEYGAGANGPFLLAVDLDRLPADQLPALD